MSYRLKAKWGKTAWLDNSFDVIDLDTANRWDYYAVWTETYGYMIEVGKTGWPDAVVFPNESEATLFVLRWS